MVISSVEKNAVREGYTLGVWRSKSIVLVTYFCVTNNPKIVA